MQLPDFLLSHANSTKRILKRNIVFPQIIPFARGDLTIRKCVPAKKGRVSTPALRETRLRASLSETNANYTLTKLRVQFVSRPGGVEPQTLDEMAPLRRPSVL